MAEWLAEHRELIWWVSIGSLAMLVGGIIAVPILLARLPSDYFARPVPPPASGRGRHPLLRASLRAIKNLLGAVLLAAGIAMLILPGQGVLTILLGLSLLEFPGKRRLEIAIVRRPAVRKAIDWIRARRGRPPLELP
jgi:hypothetical protein